MITERKNQIKKEINFLEKTRKNAESNKRCRSRNEGEERKVRCIKNTCEQGYVRKGREDVLGMPMDRDM
jgi:hypothetical protein